jgi:hypothetical protein
MNFKELQHPKRLRDGKVCISDTCISVGKGEWFETAGEFCSECSAGLLPEQVTVENVDEINLIRLSIGQKKMEV